MIIAEVQIQSRITLEKHNYMLALLQFSGGDFQCAIRECTSEYGEIKNKLSKIFIVNPMTETIRAIDDFFGREYFTLKDIFIEERRKILQILLKERLDEFAKSYEHIYNEGRSSVLHLQDLGLDIPDEFKISAQYTLSKQFNDLFTQSNAYIDENIIQLASDINFEAKRIGIKLDKKPTSTLFSKKIAENINRLVFSFEYQQADMLHDLLDEIEKLDIKVDISDAQNIFYTKIITQLNDLIENMSTQAERNLIEQLFDIAKRLNINVGFYQEKFDKILLSK